MFNYSLTILQLCKRKRWSFIIFYLFMLCHVGVSAQNNITVSGKVTGENNEALSGVSVSVGGTSQATSTDPEGNFSISAPSGGTLHFSYVGYADQTVNINGRTAIYIVMQSDAKGLDEVVVTGYTAQRKKDITGAVSVVDVKALKTVPGSSVMQSLQGQAAGVNVINSGSPGEASKIFIRGVSSLGNTDPLVLIDGVQGNLNNIIPDDVESVQVLKDAGAAAIYGSRGSNGVIVVTTKKGKAGKMQVNYDSWYNVQLPGSSNAFNMMNSEEYAREYSKLFPGTQLFPGGQIPDYLYRGPGVGQGGAMEGDPLVDPARYNFDAPNPNNNYIIQKVNKQGTDMYSEVFNTALWMNHNVSLSGGSDKASYLMSLGYLNHQGTLMDTWNKRYQIRVNTEYKINKNIKVGENVLAFFRDSRMIGNGANATFNSVTSSRLWVPILPVYDIAGNYGGTFAGPELGSWGNAVAEQKRTVNDRNNSYQVNGNVYVDVTFLKNFNFRSSFGGTVNNFYVQDFTFNGYNNEEGFNGTNSLKETAGYGTNAMWTNTLTYRQGFGKHGVTALLGTESVENRGRQLQGQAMGFFSTNYEYLVLSNGTSALYPTNDNGVYENALFSTFGRVDYDFDGKYLISGTIRRDGYSMFGANEKYGVFPSASVGWRLSQESFMSSVNWISDLKLRASHGVLGNKENLGPNNPYTLYAQTQTRSYYDLNGTGNSAISGFHPLSIGNPNTRWERNLLTNVGVDASLFNGSLDINFEWYKKYIDGLLFGMQLPATVGEAQRPSVNVGDVQNRGVDLALNYRKQISKDLRFSVGANIGAYKMEIKSMPDPGYLYYGEQVINQVGFPSSTFYGYRVLGLFSDAGDVERHAEQWDAAPGRFKFEDVNNDGVVNEDDRTHLGNPHPDFTYGINLSANYKNFDFSAIFYGSEGNEIYNATRSATDFWGGQIGNKSRRLLDAWTEDNKNTTVPKAEAARTFTTNSNTHSSYFVEDGSYFRLRALTIGYNLPGAAIKTIGLSGVRLYVQGTNLFTITKYTGLDPELAASNAMFFGQDNGNYPIQKSIVIGLNVGF